MLLRDAPGRHRCGVHLRDVVLPADVLLWQPQFRDGHKGRERLNPAHGHILDGHVDEIRAELDVELVGALAQLRHERGAKDLLLGIGIENPPHDAVGELLNRCHPLPVTQSWRKRYIWTASRLNSFVKVRWVLVMVSSLSLEVHSFEFTISIFLGQDETAQEAAAPRILSFERKSEALCPETLGLKLDEAKTILAEIQRALVTAQATQELSHHCTCPDCGKPYPKSGSPTNRGPQPPPIRVPIPYKRG